MTTKHRISQDGDVATQIDNKHAVTQTGEVLVNDGQGWVNPSTGKRYW